MQDIAFSFKHLLMFCDCHLAKIQDKDIRLKVNNSIVSGSYNVAEDGVTSFICYFHDAQLIHYLGKAETGTYHCDYGLQIVNAYKARDFNKPSISVNIQPWKVGPSKIEHGKISTTHEVVTLDLEENRKIKLVAYLFMMQHWGEDSAKGIQLNYQLGNKDSLVETINSIVQQLKTKKLLNLDAPNAIKKQEVVLTAGENRSGLVQQLYEYFVNDAYTEDITKARDKSWYEAAFDINYNTFVVNFFSKNISNKWLKQKQLFKT